jgi:hypothetical protein
MKYEYLIVNFPENTSGYNVAAFTDGNLRIIVSDAVFLDASGILLVEFAIVLARWVSLVNVSHPKDFYYASMDFEEEPIFELKYDEQNGIFSLCAVWAEGKSTKVGVEIAIEAARDYIERLNEDLNAQYSIDLTKIINDTLAKD